MGSNVQPRKTLGAGCPIWEKRLLCKERLDGLMEQFKETQPDFYNAYHAARDIIDTGHRKRPRR
jgi:hypothetical protein